MTGQYCVDGVETWWCLGRNGRREVASLRLMQYTPQEMIRRRCLFGSHLVFSTCASLRGRCIALASGSYRLRCREATLTAGVGIAYAPQATRFHSYQVQKFSLHPCGAQ